MSSSGHTGSGAGHGGSLDTGRLLQPDSPTLSSGCPASPPGHVLRCAQHEPTEATTAPVLCARGAVGVRAGVDVHHSVCARARGAAWHACAHACASVQPCGHEHVQRNVCSLRHHGHEGGGPGAHPPGNACPTRPQPFTPGRGEGSRGSRQGGGARAPPRPEPLHVPCPSAQPAGALRLRMRGACLHLCSSAPWVGDSSGSAPPSAPSTVADAPIIPLRSDPRKTRGPEPSPRGARREAAGHPHPCWVPAFLQTC